MNVLKAFVIHSVNYLESYDQKVIMEPLFAPACLSVLLYNWYSGPQQFGELNIVSQNANKYPGRG